MYFNSNKNNTNIDNEFNDKENVLSHIMNFFSKYKKIFLISIVVIVLLIVMLLLFMNRKVDNYLILNGDEIVTLYQGSDYVEPGYSAYNSKNEDLTSTVTIESNLDNDVVGKYEIVYKIGDVSKVRIVNVIDKPEDYTFIHLTSVNSNTVDIYLQKGDVYKEPGYTAISSTGEDLTNKVVVTGKVDTSKKGTYKLTYSVVDSSGVTISKVRKVIVMDSDISLTLNPEGYTNKDVTINVNVIDEYFDYMMLPDNTKVTTNTYAYKVNSNGTYTFKAYNKKGNVKESSIKVNNIDKTAPSGSCSGSYQDGVSTINVNASDNIGIDRYTINGSKYTSKNITINSELKSANVTIYDKAGNSKNISCNLEDKNTPIISDKSITFSYEYIKEDDYMPYALYTPSTANEKKDIPLIVWLHGSGEVGVGESTFKKSGLLNVLNNWKLDGFNAYVICPHLAGKGYSGSWANSTSKNNLHNLIDKFVEEHNVDTNKIILTGHSLGGIGVQYMAYQRPDFYSALVVMSGYNPGVDISTLKHIPTRGYSEYISYMNTTFKNTFGSENYYQLNTSHGNVPNMAMNIDENNDNKSDLVEWMLTQ